MTLKAFQEMPALITRAEVMRVSGLTNRDISALVEAKRLTVWQRPGTVKSGEGRGARGEGRVVSGEGKLVGEGVERLSAQARAGRARALPSGARLDRLSSEKAGQRRGCYGRYYTVEVAELCGFDLRK